MSLRRMLGLVLAGVGITAITLAIYASGIQGEFLGADHALFARSPLVSPPSAAGLPGGALPSWLPQATTVLSLAADRALWGPFPAGFRTTNLALHLVATLLVLALYMRWSGRTSLALSAAMLFALHPLHLENVEVVGARGEILAALFVFLALLLQARARRLAALEAAAERRETGGTPRFLSRFRARGEESHSRSSTSAVRGHARERGIVGSPTDESDEGVDLDEDRGSDSVSMRQPTDSVAMRQPTDGVATRQPFLIGLALLSFLIATFASPIALVIPLMIVLVDLFNSPSVSKAFRRFGLEWCLFTAAAIPSLLAQISLAAPVAPRNRWLAGRAAVEELRLLFVPYPLDSHRMLGPVEGFDAGSLLAIAVAVALVLAIVLFLYFARSAPAWLPSLPGTAGSRGPDPLPDGRKDVRGEHPLLLTLLPVLGLVIVPPAAPISDIAFPVPEHRLYLASAGACLVLVHLIGALCGSIVSAARIRTPAVARAAAVVVSVAVAAVFAVIIAERIPVFRNDVELYADAAAQHPRSADLRVQFAHTVASRGKPDRAIEIVQPLAEQKPADARLRLFLGNLNRDARKLEAAENETREALRLDPSLAPAHLTLGLIERERGDLSQTEVEYREAIRLDPVLAEAHSNLGALLRAKGETQEALSELKRAVELDPANGDAVANLGNFLFEQNRADEALEVLRQGLRFSEADARLHYSLGVILQKRGDRAGAKQAYSRAILLDPSYARPLNNMAVLLTEEKQYDQAIDLLNKLVELEPRNERAHYNLGIVHRSKGDTKAAAAEFAAALKLRPDYAEASRALTDLFTKGETRPGSSGRP